MISSFNNTSNFGASFARRTGSGDPDAGWAIGTRIALGSPRGNIFRLVLRQAVIMVGVGIVLGLTLAIACGPLFRHFVYGVAAHDPLTIFAAAAVLTSIALLACWVPARRAIAVNPMVALRHE